MSKSHYLKPSDYGPLSKAELARRKSPKWLAARAKDARFNASERRAVADIKRITAEQGVPVLDYRVATVWGKAGFAKSSR